MRELPVQKIRSSILFWPLQNLIADEDQIKAKKNEKYQTGEIRDFDTDGEAFSKVAKLFKFCQGTSIER